MSKFKKSEQDSNNSTNSKKSSKKSDRVDAKNTDTSTPSLSQNAKPVSLIDKKNVEELLSRAISRFKLDYLNDKKIKFKEISNLASIAEEYMSCFALIGYSIQNEKVVVFSIPTAKDEAALVDLLRSTFIEIVSNRP